jgi:hypothetical protein
MAFTKKKSVYQNNTYCGCNHCASGHDSISEKLSELPVIKAKPDFDRKLAAAFAMELQQEVDQKNRAWLKKSNAIRLPDLISDARREFL